MTDLSATPDQRLRGQTREMCSAWGCRSAWDKRISETVPLCWWHFAEAHAAWRNFVEREDDEREAKPAHERTITVRRAEPGSPVVYYVSMPPFVKIGTTTSFARRMREFYVQPEDVLAVEPGGRNLEASRHQQFASYRKHGTELFTRNAVLDELIASLRRQRPDPWQAAFNIHYPLSTAEDMNLELFEAREKLGLLPPGTYRASL